MFWMIRTTRAHKSSESTARNISASTKWDRSLFPCDRWLMMWVETGAEPSVVCLFRRAVRCLWRTTVTTGRSLMGFWLGRTRSFRWSTTPYSLSLSNATKVSTVVHKGWVGINTVKPRSDQTLTTRCRTLTLWLHLRGGFRSELNLLVLLCLCPWFRTWPVHIVSYLCLSVSSVCLYWSDIRWSIHFTERATGEIPADSEDWLVSRTLLTSPWRHSLCWNMVCVFQRCVWWSEVGLWEIVLQKIRSENNKQEELSVWRGESSCLLWLALSCLWCHKQKPEAVILPAALSSTNVSMTHRCNEVMLMDQIVRATADQWQMGHMVMWHLCFCPITDSNAERADRDRNSSENWPCECGTHWLQQLRKHNHHLSWFRTWTNSWFSQGPSDVLFLYWLILKLKHWWCFFSQ